MDKLFLDANILFSAAYRGRSFLFLWEEASLGLTQLVTSAYACEEAKRNLAVKSPKSLASFQTLMQHVTLVPEAPRTWHCPVALSQKDQPILGAASRAQAHFLITGNTRDFGHLFDHPIDNLRITTLKNYLQHRGYLKVREP